MHRRSYPSVSWLGTCSGTLAMVEQVSSTGSTSERPERPNLTKGLGCDCETRISHAGQSGVRYSDVVKLMKHTFSAAFRLEASAFSALPLAPLMSSLVGARIGHFSRHILFVPSKNAAVALSC
jgi:hypothetical protein